MNLLRAAVVFSVLVLGLAGCQKSFNWNITLNEDGEEPYDLLVFHDLLRDAAGSDWYKKIEYGLKQELQKADDGTLYIYFGQYPDYSPDELKQMREFVNGGGKVFILSRDFENEIYDSVTAKNTAAKLGDSAHYEPSTPLRSFAAEKTKVISSGGNEAQIYYKIKSDIKQSNWRYYGDSLLAVINPVRHAAEYGDGKPFIIEKKAGKGSVYFCADPMIFTNYHMKKKEVFDVVNDIVKDIDHEGVLYDVSRTAFSQTEAVDRGPLHYLFSYASFRRAWTLLLIMTVLYLAFNLKRRQRVMPLQAAPSNNAAIFAQTAGLLFYKSKAHLQIARKKSEVFLFEVNRKYGISTYQLNDNFINALSNKTGKPRYKVKELAAKLNALNGLNHLSEDSLKNILRMIEEFRDE